LSFRVRKRVRTACGPGCEFRPRLCIPKTLSALI